ncbi:MAG: alpha/beta hydrolase [Pseudomonadota bacterium]
MTGHSTTAPVSAFVDAGDARIHYLDWGGDKPPLLIVHGNTHAGGVYSPLAQRLSKDFRVVAMDMRGHGLSSNPGHFTWPAMRDDVTSLIDHLRLDKLLIVAHSRGGGVSMLATCARRKRIRGLIVFEPTVPLRVIDPAMPVEAQEAWARNRLARSEGRRATFPNREAAYAHYRGRGSFKDWEDEYLRAFIEHGIVDAPGGCELASSPEVESQLVRMRASTEGWEDLGPCDVPVLALFGENGGRIGNPASDSRAAIASVFSNTRVEVMPGVTHTAPMEQPAAFEAIVRGFAEGLPA